MTSIMHRITGFGLALGAVAATWWLGSVMLGAGAYETFYTFFASKTGQLLLFGWLWALVYHLLNGVRHLFWDMAIGVNIKSAYATGWLIVFGSMAISAALWIFRLQGYYG